MSQPVPELWERGDAIAAIRAAAAEGRHLLVHGPPGVGKSAVLRAALEGERPRPLFCDAATAAGFYRQALAMALAPRPLPSGSLSSLRCRGLLERAFAATPCCLVWDPAPMASRAVANRLRDLLRFCSVPLLAAAVSPHMEDIGYLSILFILQSEKLRLAPLSEAAARACALAEQRRLEVEFEDEATVLNQILRWAQGCPGRIRTMLAMTAMPRYRRQGRIKLNVLHLDLTAGIPEAPCAATAHPST
jgi:hypothetical protein